MQWKISDIVKVLPDSARRISTMVLVTVTKGSVLGVTMMLPFLLPSEFIDAIEE